MLRLTMRRVTSALSGRPDCMVETQHATSLPFPYRSTLDALLIVFSLEDSFHVNARRHHLFRIDFADLYQFFYFNDRHLGGSRHHGRKVARRFAKKKVSPLVTLPCIYQREICGESPFHHIRSTLEVARLLPFCAHRADSGWSKKSRNAGASGTNTLGKRSLRHKLEIELLCENQVFQKLVLADIRSNMALDLTGLEQQPQSPVIDPDVIADGSKVLHPSAYHRRNQIFWDATQPEATKHYCRSVLNVEDGVFSVC